MTAWVPLVRENPHHPPLMLAGPQVHPTKPLPCLALGSSSPPTWGALLTLLPPCHLMPSTFLHALKRAAVLFGLFSFWYQELKSGPHARQAGHVSLSYIPPAPWFYLSTADFQLVFASSLIPTAHLPLCSRMIQKPVCTPAAASPPKLPVHPACCPCSPCWPLSPVDLLFSPLLPENVRPVDI